MVKNEDDNYFNFISCNYIFIRYIIILTRGFTLCLLQHVVLAIPLDFSIEIVYAVEIVIITALLFFFFNESFDLVLGISQVRLN